MERIGIFGGTFNPPHIGHMRAAEFAMAHLNLSRLLMIPTGISPHKQVAPGASSRQRLEMLKLCIDGMPGVEASDLELRREGKSYTADTIDELRRVYPRDELVLLMGTDMFLSFDHWYCPEKIIREAVLGVFYRGNPREREAVEAQKQKLEAMGARVELVENPVTEISSSDLRRMLMLHCADPFLCPQTADYIRRKNLYGVGRDLRNLPMDQLEEAVVSLLKPSRVRHVLGVAKMAGELAEAYGADGTDAQRAGLLHDVTKALDGPLQLTFCQQYGIVLNKFSTENPKTLHALTGSIAARERFGENEAVCTAIRWHTTGRAEMGLLEKIVYLADYAEENRDFPGVEKLREAVWRDLDEGMHLGLEMTLEQLRGQQRQIAPASLEAAAYFQALCQKK